MKAKKNIWKFIFICIWFESISKNGYCYYYYIFWLKFANQWKTNHIYFSILSVFVRVITEVQRALILWPVWKSFWKIHIYIWKYRPPHRVGRVHASEELWVMLVDCFAGDILRKLWFVNIHIFLFKIHPPKWKQNKI